MAFLQQMSLPKERRLAGLGTNTFDYSRDEIRNFEKDYDLVRTIIVNELTGNMQKELEQYSDETHHNTIPIKIHKKICSTFLKQLSLPLRKRISGLDTNTFAYSQDEIEFFHERPSKVADIIRNELTEYAFINLKDAVENLSGMLKQQQSKQLEALKEEIANNIFL